MLDEDDQVQVREAQCTINHLGWHGNHFILSDEVHLNAQGKVLDEDDHKLIVCNQSIHDSLYPWFDKGRLGNIRHAKAVYSVILTYTVWMVIIS